MVNFFPTDLSSNKNKIQHNTHFKLDTLVRNKGSCISNQ